MDKVEWDDVQRLVLSGYPQLPAAAYLLWNFRSGEVAAAKQWLQSLAGRLTCAVAPGGGQAINLALTARGLERIQLSQSALSMFSMEFLEGMAPKPTERGASRRSNILGDLGESSPEFWEWGGWNRNRDIDGLLLLYASDISSLAALLEAELKAMAHAAEPILQENGQRFVLEGRIYEDRKEHFGFKDGISQPMIEGSPKAERSKKRKTGDGTQGENGGLTADERRIHLVKPGEFVLGYENERRSRVPGIFHGQGDKYRQLRDIRRNGTYLVFRQLEQDVHAFNDFVASAAEHVYGRTDDVAREDMAARLVGRTREGHPLVPMAERDGAAERNDFLYHFEDRSGMACPIGAHIRRANPRDMIGPDPDTALRLSKMHRIIRRGRPYGERLVSGAVRPESSQASRGIAFIALNADIAGQFEMIQHSWLNNTNFAGLHAGTDPFGHFGNADVVAIQNRPVNHYISRPRPFVRVRGGAYFFMPGIEAVLALARDENF